MPLVVSLLCLHLVNKEELHEEEKGRIGEQARSQKEGHWFRLIFRIHLSGHCGIR